MSSDQVLTHLGDFGLYQKRVCVLVGLLNIYTGFPFLVTVFLATDIPFRCSVPNLQNDTYNIQNEAHQLLVNASIPFDVSSGIFSQCSRYLRSEIEDGNATEVPCDTWVYDPEFAPNSMVKELNLVCDRRQNKAHFTLVLMMGMMLAPYVSGWASDTFGRKIPMIIFLHIQTVALIVLVTVTSSFLTVMMIVTFFLAACNFASFLNCYTLVMELIGPSGRTFAGFSPMLGWSIGLCLSVPYYYFIRNWRVAVIGQIVASSCFVSFWWWMPESPRWLLSQNRHEDAQKIFKKMAKVNKRTLPEELELTSVVKVKASSEEKEEKRSGFLFNNIRTLFTSKVILKRIATLSAIWFSLNMVYTGTTFSIGELIEGDLYVNFFIQATMELAGYILTFVLMKYFKRRHLLCAFLMISGVSFLLNAVFMHMDIATGWVSAVCFGMGKFGNTGAFLIIYVVVNEVMPTVVRNTATGIGTGLGQFGGVIAPYLMLMKTVVSGTIGKTFPMFIFGALSIIAGLLTLLLPETKNRKLPDTIEEAENLRKISV